MKIRAVLALLLIAALPLVADALRARPERCEMDGVAVTAAFRVRVVDPSGATHSFCGVSCALAWLARQGVAPREVLVTDCATGREVDARGATFVRTLSTWSGGAPDFIRVFARAEDAERHVDAYGGTILDGLDRPFADRGE